MPAESADIRESRENQAIRAYREIADFQDRRAIADIRESLAGRDIAAPQDLAVIRERQDSQDLVGRDFRDIRASQASADFRASAVLMD